jgi:hypothetical protein
MFVELLMEANAQTGILKLPESAFGKHREIMKTALFRSMREEAGGDDPRIESKRKEISHNN